MKLPTIQADKAATEKEYLGDGLYARALHGQVWLTAENGIEVLEQVALDPSTLAAFLKYAERFKA